MSSSASTWACFMRSPRAAIVTNRKRSRPNNEKIVHSYVLFKRSTLYVPSDGSWQIASVEMLRSNAMFIKRRTQGRPASRPPNDICPMLHWPILASATIWDARVSAAMSSWIPDPLFMVAVLNSQGVGKSLPMFFIPISRRFDHAKDGHTKHTQICHCFERWAAASACGNDTMILLFNGTTMNVDSSTC